MDSAFIGAGVALFGIDTIFVTLVIKSIARKQRTLFVYFMLALFFVSALIAGFVAISFLAAFASCANASPYGCSS